MFALVLLVMSGAWLPGIGHGLEHASDPVEADAIVVLAGGGPNRLLHGLDLYRRGLAPELWYTGDQPREQLLSFTEGRLAYDLARREGVPAEALRLLPSSTTWEDAEAALALARQESRQRLLVVTSWYHGRRAMCAFERVFAGSGIRVAFSAAPAGRYGPDNWWQDETMITVVASELVKYGLYVQRYGLAPWQC